MDYKKKYSDLIERLRKAMDDDNVNDERYCCVIKDIVPELEEPDDERIRKAIVDVFKTHCDYEVYFGVSVTDILAWLEKQGEQKSTLPKWKYKKDNTPLLRDSLILNKYGCVAKSPSGAIVSDVWVIDYDELAKLPKEEFEKQGEQKPADKVEPKFKVGDEIKTKNEESLIITRIDRWGYWSEDLFICNFDDADKWELVEQKPAWNEEDESLFIRLLDKLHSDSCISFDSWLMALRKRVQPQTKQGWSEEDNAMLISIENILIGRGHSFHDKEINWLKSLKDRVQPKQEWSDDDESMLYGVIETEQYMLDVVNGIKKFDVWNGDIRKACAEELNWLKTLKKRVQPQSTWKPSGEQMKALRAARATFGVDDVVLASLIYDLEKLKE